MSICAARPSSGGGHTLANVSGTFSRTSAELFTVKAAPTYQSANHAPDTMLSELFMNALRQS